MKKVMFIQNEGNVVGGVWYVNKTIAEQLIKKGYEVQIISIRNGQTKVDLKYNNKIVVKAINPSLPWKLMRKKDVICSLKHFKIITFFRNLKQYFVEQYELKKDYRKLKKYINLQNPDYIIASDYMVLDGIPRKFLSRTIHEQHSSFDAVINTRKNYKILKKYNTSLYALLWLSKSAYKQAEKKGFKNNIYIYNPIKFNTSQISNVVKNKKLIVISRIEDFNKRITLMIKMVDQVLNEPSLKDWTFDIYGVGELSDTANKIIQKNHRISYKGVTDDPMNVLLHSSINLNTSISEGFSLSILEAAICGVPTISFDFGESAYEEIIDKKTGIIIRQGEEQKYVTSLIALMNETERLYDFSVNSKKHAQQFLPENIVFEWINLFQMMDNRNGDK